MLWFILCVYVYMFSGLMCLYFCIGIYIPTCSSAPCTSIKIAAFHSIKNMTAPAKLNALRKKDETSAISHAMSWMCIVRASYCSCSSSSMYALDVPLQAFTQQARNHRTFARKSISWIISNGEKKMKKKKRKF